MRRLILLFAVTLSFTNFSQNDWTKDERNNLYQDYLNVLTSRKELSQEQKETVALCCLDETTKKYSRKEYAAKIEVEIKRIQSSTLTHCAKMSGIELNPEQVEIVETPVVSSTEWTKEDKEKLAKEAKAYLTKYEHLTDDQNESLTLCYIQTTTSEIEKESYKKMIDLELKQHQQKTISACAKSNKIELTTPVAIVPEKIGVSKEILTGTWKTDQGTTITFNANGTFIKTYSDNIYTTRFNRIEDQTIKGEWFLDAQGVLTMNEDWVEVDYSRRNPRKYPYKTTGKYSFETISSDFFKMIFIEGNYCCVEANQPSQTITQANKVK